MKRGDYTRLSTLVPWAVALLLLGALFIIGLTNRTVINPYTNIVKKIDILSLMRINLLKAVEAEKNAVLAEITETSIAFADQARRAARAVETGRKQLDPIIREERIPREMQLISEFDSCWTQYRKLEEVIFDLVTQGTNIKAERLSSTRGAEAIGRFEDSLTGLIKASSNDSQCNQVVKLSYEALTAGLKIHGLHKPHIEAAADEEMDRIERSIRSYDKSVRDSLHALSDLVAPGRSDDVKAAVGAYDDFVNVTDEVVKLSRINTNIKSVELSLGRKRTVSAQCQEILTTLQEAVQSQRFKATR